MATIRKSGTAQWEARIREKGWPITGKTFIAKILAEQWLRPIESKERARRVHLTR